MLHIKCPHLILTSDLGGRYYYYDFYFINVGWMQSADETGLTNQCFFNFPNSLPTLHIKIQIFYCYQKKPQRSATLEYHSSISSGCLPRWGMLSWVHQSSQPPHFSLFNSQVSMLMKLPTSCVSVNMFFYLFMPYFLHLKYRDYNDTYLI